MVNSISRVSQNLGQEDFGAESITEPSVAPAANPQIKFQGNMFEDVLTKAVDALNGVSQQEFYANQMISRYTKGEVDMADVMLATSKMNIMVNLAVTVINSAVTTFKEVTQMQI